MYENIEKYANSPKIETALIKWLKIKLPDLSAASSLSHYIDSEEIFQIVFFTYIYQKKPRADQPDLKTIRSRSEGLRDSTRV